LAVNGLFRAVLNYTIAFWDDLHPQQLIILFCISFNLFGTSKLYITLSSWCIIFFYILMRVAFALLYQSCREYWLAWI